MNAVQRLAAAAAGSARTRQAGRLAALRRLAEVARAWVTESRSEARGALARSVAAYEKLGTPVALFRIMGLSRRELPYNRVLAWLLDPEADHGAGRVLLAVLADALGMPRLATDVRAGEFIDVRGEFPWPDSVGSSGIPDLLVISPHAALVVENKVEAPESGRTQYRRYHDALQVLAEDRGLVERRLVLCAPERRQLPGDGAVWSWDRVHTHGELATIFRRAADRSEMPAWGRVCCLLFATQLDRRRPAKRALAEARELLSIAEPTATQIARMRALQRWLGDPPTPWREDVDLG